MTKYSLIFVLLALFTSRVISNEPALEVKLALGKLYGSQMETWQNRTIFAFRGIRYAEPPVGQQRFQPAQPVKEPWNETIDASKEGPSCPFPGAIDPSEDCLRLNVYTTDFPDDKHAPEVKPVIVFFHSGGFYESSGRSDTIGPQYLLDEDIVLVTVNYRLASLGFMSMGNAFLPGNLGLKDQVVALRWVKDNIAKFGGDSGCVTIMGDSAGGWSVSLHLVSPMSEGLFHRAIVMSSSAIFKEPLPHDQKHLANKQAELLDCPTDATGNLLICLNTKSVEEINNTTDKFFEWQKDPIIVWSPVVEPEIPDLERFLPAQPVDLIRQGKFHQVPVLTGITKDECSRIIVEFIEDAQKNHSVMANDMNANWTRIAPVSFVYERDTERSKEISEKLKKFYFKSESIEENNFLGLSELYADAISIFSVHRFTKLIAEYSKEPVYYYKFSYQGRYSHATWKNSEPVGVAHMDDLIYLFNSEKFPLFDSSMPESTTVKRMTAMWSTFAKTGNPIPKDRDEEFAGINWTPFTKDNHVYLDIGSELTLKSRLYEDRMSFWEQLFPLPEIEKS